MQTSSLLKLINTIKFQNSTTLVLLKAEKWNVTNDKILYILDFLRKCSVYNPS